MVEVTCRRVGSTGCEILVNNEVVAWTIDETWAAIVVAALKREQS